MSKAKVGTKTERRNKAVVLLVAVMMLAVCVASVMPSFGNDNTNNNDAVGVGYVSPKVHRPAAGDEIEINTIEDLVSIGVDTVNFPLDEKYILMSDLNFSDVGSYVDQQGMDDYLESLGWQIRVTAIASGTNVTFTIEYNAGTGFKPLVANIQYTFGLATSNSLSLTNGSLVIPNATSGFDGTTPLAFILGGVANVGEIVAADANFAFSMYAPSAAAKTSYHMGNFAPIGADGTGFTGKFDGNGYTITGMETAFLKLDGTADNVNLSSGMFAQISITAAISNLVLEKGSMTSAMVALSNTVTADDASFAGGIVGYATGTAKVNNCSTDRTVISSTGAGGIVGSTGASGATVSNSTNTGSVTAYGTTGAGIVGVANSPISNCYNKGSVTAPIYAAGIVAILNSNGSVGSCNNGGTVTITDSTSVFIGGIVGRAFADISGVYNSGRIKGVTSAGGIIGKLEAGYSVSSARNNGEVTAAVNVGGIVGHSFSEVSGSINYGIVTSAGDNVGGIVGKAETTAATVSNSLNYGPITGNNYVGGIVGNAAAPIKESLNYGDVTATLTGGGTDAVAGGVAGITTTDATVTDCGHYYRAVTAEDYAGGIVGYAQAAILRPGNYGTVVATGTAGAAGGIVGTTSANITDAMNKSVNAATTSTEILGKSATDITGFIAGGIAGTVSSGVTIIGSANNGGIVNANAGGIAGGIVGKTIGNVTIEDSYDIGKISASGAGTAGGIVGYADGSITVDYAYSTTDLSASIKGGIIAAGTTPASMAIKNTFSVNGTDIAPAGFANTDADQVSLADLSNSAKYDSGWSDWTISSTYNGGMPTNTVFLTHVLKTAINDDQHIYNGNSFAANYMELENGKGGAFMEYDWYVSYDDGYFSGTYTDLATAKADSHQGNSVIDEYSYSPILFDKAGDASRAYHLWFKCQLTPAIAGDLPYFSTDYLHAAYYGMTISTDMALAGTSGPSGYEVKYTLVGSATGSFEKSYYADSESLVLLRAIGASAPAKWDRDHAELKVDVTSLDTKQKFDVWTGPNGTNSTESWTIGPRNMSGSGPGSYHSDQPLVLCLMNFFEIQCDDETTAEYSLDGITYTSYTGPGVDIIWLKKGEPIYVKATTIAVSDGYEFRGWDGINPNFPKAGAPTAVYTIDKPTKAIAESSPSLDISITGTNGETKISGDLTPFGALTVKFQNSHADPNDYTFQWEESIGGTGSFTTISGANAISYTPAPTIGQGFVEYRCVVKYKTDTTGTLPDQVVKTNPLTKGIFYGLMGLGTDSPSTSVPGVTYSYSVDGGKTWINTGIPAGGAAITGGNLQVRANNLSANGAGIVKWTSYLPSTTTVDITKSGNTATWTYGAPTKNIDAKAELGYMVTFSGPGGSVTGTIGGTTVSSPVPLGIGQTLDLTATPSPGYRFDGWTGAVTSVSGNTAVVSGSGLSSATTIGATFTEQIRITDNLTTPLQKKYISDPNQLEVTLSDDTGISYQWQKREKGTSAWTDITTGGDDRLLNLEPTVAGVQWEYQCVMTKTVPDGTVPLKSNIATVAMYYALTMGADYTHVPGSLQYQFPGDSVRNYAGRTLLEFNNLAVTSVDLIFNNANDLKFIEWVSGPNAAKWTKAITGDTYAEAKTGYTISLATPSNGTVVAKIGTGTVEFPLILGKDQTIDFVATPDAGWKFNNWTDLAGSASTSLSGSAVTGPRNIVANFTNHLGFATDLPGGLQKMFIGDDNKLEVVLVDSTDVDYKWFARKAGTTTWNQVGGNSSILTLTDTPAGEQWEYYCETSKDDGTVPLDSSVAVVAMFYGLTIVDPDHQAAAEAGSLQYQFMSDTTGSIMVPVEDYLGGKVMLENGGYAVTSLRVIFDNTAGDLQFIKWGNGSTDVVYPFASVTDDITVNVKSGYRVYSALYSHGDVTAKLNGVTLSMPFDLVLGVDDILELTATPTTGGYMPNWIGAIPGAAVGVAIVDGSTLTAELEVDPDFTKVLTVVIDDSGVTGEEMGSPQTLKANVTNSSGNPETYQWYVKDKDGNWKMIDGATTDTLIITEQDAGKVEYRCEVSALGVKPLDSDPATVALYRVLTLPTIPAADGKMQYRLAGGAWVDYTAPVLLKDAAGEPITDVSVRFVPVADSGKGVAQWSAGNQKTDVQEFSFTVSDDLLDASGNISVGVKFGFGVTIDVGEGGHVEYSRDGGETYQEYDGSVVYVGVDEVVFKAVGDATYDFEDWLNTDGPMEATVDGDKIVIKNVTAPTTFGVEFERAYRLLPFLVFFVTVVSALIVGFALVKKKSSA